MELTCERLPAAPKFQFGDLVRHGDGWIAVVTSQPVLGVVNVMRERDGDYMADASCLTLISRHVMPPNMTPAPTLERTPEQIKAVADKIHYTDFYEVHGDLWRRGRNTTWIIRLADGLVSDSWLDHSKDPTLRAVRIVGPLKYEIVEE